MFLEQGLSAGDVLRELVSADDRLGVVDPADEVTVVGQEAVQVVRVLQVGAPVPGLYPPAHKQHQLNTGLTAI